MANLRDQLLKAGLITPDQAKRAGHEQRQDHKRLGREGKAQQAEARREEARQQQRQRADADRRRGQDRQHAQEERERAQQQRQHRQALIERALREGQLARWEGARPYYFRDGKEVLFLMVNEETARLLEGGKAAIVRANGRGRYALVQAGYALELAEVAPERLVTFHRG
jgi:uncharacterized protein YaiL (DUF2058 family)